jgi:hypothetical protein
VEKPSTRNWDWLTGSLLFLLIQVASARLVTTNWTAYLYFSETLAALGTIIGLALGASSFGRRMVLWLTFIYSAIFVPWQMTGAVTDNLFLDRLKHVGAILATSLNLFVQGAPVYESLFFVAFICVVFWFISLAAGYWLIRHNNTLVSIIPSFIAILLIQIYDNYRANASWWLAIFMLLALLLLGREYYLQNKKIWTKRRVFINEESWPNIFSGLFTTVTVALVIVWMIPTSLSSFQSATESWNRLTRPLIDRLSNAVSSLNKPYGRAGDNYYGDILTMGRDAGQGESTVFTVEIMNKSDISVRYYWQGRVYDYYKNGQWSTSSASVLDFHPDGGDLKIPNPADRSESLLKFTIQFPSQSLIYAPSQPVWVDRPGIITDTLTDTNLNDVMTWESTTAIQSRGQYQVRAEIANPTIQRLRNASVLYPGWVKDRYLEVPDNLKVAIKELADKVSGVQGNPYDKAEAITNYLRTNIQYATSLPALPANQDPVIWFLFNYKKGFCNYYASAEVLMLRSLGIPARLAVGFAEGQYQNGAYMVRQRDAHAWPEVYFPDIGWVEFEPTVSQDALVRPDGSSQANSPLSGVSSPSRSSAGEAGGQHTKETGILKNVNGLPFAQTVIGRTLIIASIILWTVVIIFLLRRYHVISYLPVYLSIALDKGGITSPDWIKTWSLWNQSEPVERLFTSINWSLNQLGKPQSIDTTPAERSRLLKKLLPSAAKDIDTLTYEFESGLFTPRIADLTLARRSSFSIVAHTIRAKIHNYLDTIDEGDVYSR